MIGQQIMRQELFGKKTAAKFVVAAALSAALTPAAWAKADDYTPLGIKNGPFTIFLNGGVGIEYNNNLFALNDGDITDLNSIGIDEDDFIAHLKTGIEARGRLSGGSTLDFYANGHFGAHFERDNANFFDAKVGMRSRTFFSKSVSLRSKSEYSYEHEGFGLFDTPLSAPLVTPSDVETFLNSAEPTTLSKVSGELALDIKPGRTGFTVGAKSTGRFFNDKNGLSAEHRNYWDVNVFTEFSQEIDTTTGFFVRLNGNGRAYPDRPSNDPMGLPERDSLGFSAVAGARVKATGTIDLEAFAGYVSQNFENDDFDDISDYVFGGNMTWSPSAFFEMKVNADRSIYETTDATQTSFIGTKAETTLSIFPLENLTFWTTGRYVNRDYDTRTAVDGIAFSTADRDDDILFGEIGGEFKINRNVGIGLFYNYYQRESTISNNANYIVPNLDIDFDRQKVMFEINLAR